MPNRIASKLGLCIAICGGLTALLALAILVFEFTGPIDAAIWHMRHGSTVSFNGHRFHLPVSWYPDPDIHPGQLSLQHTQFAAADATRITLAAEPRTPDDHAAAAQIAAMTANLNQQLSGPSAHWTTETLRSRTLTFHCTMSTQNGVGETLICQAASANLRILAVTLGRAARAQALNIIETSE